MAAANEGSPDGLPRFAADIPACPLSFDVVNGGVIACGYGEERADAAARDILAEAYPGRHVVTVDAREILARGGGIHCITQQQPSRPVTPLAD